jgi:hypothetical protein
MFGPEKEEEHKTKDLEFCKLFSLPLVIRVMETNK